MSYDTLVCCKTRKGARGHAGKGGSRQIQYYIKPYITSDGEALRPVGSVGFTPFPNLVLTWSWQYEMLPSMEVAGCIACSSVESDLTLTHALMITKAHDQVAISHITSAMLALPRLMHSTLPASRYKSDSYSSTCCGRVRA